MAEQITEHSGILAVWLKSTPVIQFNLDGTFITANDQFLHGAGYSLSQIHNRRHRMLCNADYAAPAEYAAFWEKLRRGEYVRAGFVGLTTAVIRSGWRHLTLQSAPIACRRWIISHC